MTTNTAHGSEAHDELLSGLIRLDADTLATISTDSELIGELKRDKYSMEVVGTAIITALTIDNEGFANQLREILGVDFMALMNGNPETGRQWFELVIRMMKEKPEEFVHFKQTWQIPNMAIKFYALEHLTNEEDEPKREAIMKLADVTAEEMEMHRMEKKRKFPDLLGQAAVRARVQSTMAEQAEA